MKTLLFGAESDILKPILEGYPQFKLVDAEPDLVICYGGDGTLLSAELQWPTVPKVPIRNSRRGHRCIAHPPEEVIERLANDSLTRNAFIKIECRVHRDDQRTPEHTLTAMNEFNVHMGNINSAVRLKVWINDEGFADEAEIVGDGVVVSTPFGSTAYYNQITRGVFHAGLGIAFKNTTELTSHLVVPDNVTIRILITRGPAVLAYDNCPDYVDLGEGDRLVLVKHAKPANILTWEHMSHQCDAF
jgi:NAD+ kinase